MFILRNKSKNSCGCTLVVGATEEELRKQPLPSDAFFADGYQGLRVVSIPSRKLVVVRFGLTPNPADLEFESFLAEALGALPG